MVEIEGKLKPEDSLVTVSLCVLRVIRRVLYPKQGRDLIGRRWIVLAALALVTSISGYAEDAPGCPALDTAFKTRVLQVAARNMGTEPVLPRIDREALVPGTCYWQLFVTLPHKKGEAILYVSPDRRFASTALWDMETDFDKEDAKVAAGLLAESEADHPPVQGSENAPATVVLFSDLQCPFCARFSQMLGQYQKDNPGKVRVIFRNNPLPMHKWAKPAALAGICIAQQSTDAFWRFQNLVFSKQKETTAENFGEQVSGFLKATPEVQSDKYIACMASPYPETRLEKDLGEGESYHIHSTPTVFINGRKYGGFANAEEFAAAVDANIHSETAKREKEKK
jgi:protein-disulfide isomerase